MAAQPPTGAASKKDKRLDAIVAFAHKVQKQLPELQGKDDIRRFTDELERQIGGIKSQPSNTTPKNIQLDSLGTTIWNTCVRLGYDEELRKAPIAKALVYTRVLAFQLMVLGHGAAKSNQSDLVRLSKLALKTGKLCIAAGETDFALLALQKAADYNGLLQKYQDIQNEDEQAVYKRLEAEYYILRTTVSWKEDRLDVAEHMYSKSESMRRDLDTESAEDLADVLFEIGRDLFQKSDFDMAVKWLTRADEFISSLELETLSREAVELKLSISQALIQAFLGQGTAQSLQEAENHVASMESDMGDKLVVLLLRLEILQKSPGEVFDEDAYATILRRMIRTVSLSDSTFKLLVSHIRELNDKSPTLAMQTMDHFLFDQVLPSGKNEWIERALIIRVMFSTSRRDSVELVNGLKATFDRAFETLQKSIAGNSAIAILTMIWKKVESSSTERLLDVCESWCRLARHPLLEQCGPINAGKISRKLLLCTLEKDDLDGAREILHSMSEDVQNQPMTLYLAYKLAVRTDDAEMASKCLESVAKTSFQNITFLYACCLDAQQSGDKLCTLKALRLLADKYEFQRDHEVHFPALLRSIIRVQVSLLQSDEQPGIDPIIIINDICKTFEAVVTLLEQTPRRADGTRLFTVAELNWFSKNSYNLGIKNTPSWDPNNILQMCNACISIMQNYPNDLPNHEMADIQLRRLFCHFMISTAHIACARSEDNVESQMQHYLNSRKHTEAFGDQLENTSELDDDQCSQDLHLKLSTLLVFDFEASVSLKAWDSLGVIGRKLGVSKSLQSLQAIADILLRAHPPTQVVYSTMRLIVDEIFHLERFESEKLAKYMRCLLRVTISDTDLSLKVIDQVCTMTREAAKTSKPFPDEEVHWFATTAFERGIDYNQNREDELCRKWIDHAFSLAHYYRDGGVLEKTMHDNYTKLSWGTD